jgi:hypothetical protein
MVDSSLFVSFPPMLPLGASGDMSFGGVSPGNACWWKAFVGVARCSLSIAWTSNANSGVAVDRVCGN